METSARLPTGRPTGHRRRSSHGRQRPSPPNAASRHGAGPAAAASGAEDVAAVVVERNGARPFTYAEDADPGLVHHPVDIIWAIRSVRWFASDCPGARSFPQVVLTGPIAHAIRREPTKDNPTARPRGDRTVKKHRLTSLAAKTALVIVWTRTSELTRAFPPRVSRTAKHLSRSIKQVGADSGCIACA